MLLIVLLALEAVRSPAVKSFFKDVKNNSTTSLNNAAHGNASANQGSPQITLDWHLALYWGGGALLLLLIADPLPNVATAVLILIIAEVLLVHWADFAPLLNIPTK